VLSSRIIFGVTTLLWGFLQGPFDHIHPEELEHAVTSTPVHIHVRETLAGYGSAIAPHTADDDEVDVLWSVTTTAHIVLPADAELGERVAVPAPTLASAQILIPRHRGHDPPTFSPKIPRAPPV
jgi:hypothetical protein